MMTTRTVTSHENVEAALYNSITEKYYFFFDDGQFVEKSRAEDLKGAKPITEFGKNFPDTHEEWQDGRIDAAVFNANTEYYYFFKKYANGDWYYIEKPYGTDMPFSGPFNMDDFTNTNTQNFNGLNCAIDAATYDPIGKIYHFFNKILIFHN